MCIAQLQANSAQISIIYIVDGVHVYKLLMHRSRVNSSLCLEKSGCSQILIKVGRVLIYKWVEHVPDN